MASETFDIFVKWLDNRTITIRDVLPATTIAQVKQQLLEKLKIDSDPRRFTLVAQGKWLDDETTLREANIGRDNTLLTILRKVQEDACDKEVVAHLTSDLRAIAEYNHGKLFVFIGIGSYVGPDSTGDVKQQQCPDKLLRWCKENGWDLTVLLIDPDFSGGEDASPQIYHKADQGWLAAPFLTEAGGKIKHYTDQVGQGKHVVITYRTGIPEYSYGGSLTKRTSVGGFDLNQIASGWADCLGTHCLVSGNFFRKPTAWDQYVTIGNPDVVADCGFTANP
jgi:hypothetical protein